MNEQIEVQFDELEQVIGRFQNCGELVDLRTAAINRTAHDLVEAGWEGEGAAAFSAEMFEKVLPRMCRLRDALMSAAETAAVIGQVMQEYEEEAGSAIHNGGGGESVQKLPGKLPQEKAKTMPGVIEQNAPASYVIQPGDNLTRIAERYGVTVAELVAANNIQNPNLIYPGETLILPGRGEAPAARIPVSNPGSSYTGNEAWADFVGKTSNRMQGWGCVAQVLDTAYIPWADYGPPGNAGDWLQKAEAHTAKFPEHGISIDRTPKAGAIAVFPNYGEGYGHVAQVTSANGTSFSYDSANTWYNGQSAPQGNWYDSQGNLNGLDHYTSDSTRGGFHDVLFIHLPWEEV